MANVTGRVNRVTARCSGVRSRVAWRAHRSHTSAATEPPTSATTPPMMYRGIASRRVSDPCPMADRIATM
jgi:hypothetical protein